MSLSGTCTSGKSLEGFGALWVPPAPKWDNPGQSGPIRGYPHENYSSPVLCIVYLKGGLNLYVFLIFVLKYVNNQWI